MKEVRFLERLAENLLEGGFARALKPKLQPVQIAKALAREMDRTQLVGTDAPLVANRYTAYLHPDDFATFAQFKGALEREMADYLSGYASRRGLRPLSPPEVTLLPSPEFGRPGRIKAEASLIDREPAGPPPAPRSPASSQWEGTVEMPVVAQDPPSQLRPKAVLIDGGGQTIAVARETISVGRAVDNDIVLESKGVSRHHARITWESGHYHLVDLDSTNGSFVDGEQVKRHLLSGGEQLSIGGSLFTFRVEE